MVTLRSHDELSGSHRDKKEHFGLTELHWSFDPDSNKKELVSFILQGTASLPILPDYIHLRFSLMQSDFIVICRGAVTDFSEDWD